MAKIYDEVLGKEVYVQEDIMPEVGQEMKIEDPVEFDEILEKEEQ